MAYSGPELGMDGLSVFDLFDGENPLEYTDDETEEPSPRSMKRRNRPLVPPLAIP